SSGSGANPGTITPHMPHRHHWSLSAMGGTGLVCPYPHLAGVGCPSPHNPASTAAVTIQRYATERVFAIIASEGRGSRVGGIGEAGEAGGEGAVVDDGEAVGGA